MSDVVTAHLNGLRRMIEQGGPRGMLESNPSESPPPSGPIPAARVDEIVSRTEAELLRIVKKYLNDADDKKDVVKQIASRGKAALKEVGVNDAAFADPQTMADLEAILRPDGSRPSFLIHEGAVDLESSPATTWADRLAVASNELEKAIACIGRIDDPTLTGPLFPTAQEKYGGTGVLIQDNLILTNRHVLQQIASRSTTATWKLHPGTAIDFGHEYRGWESVAPRKLKDVVFVGDKEINPYSVDHAKLDLAVIELEPATTPVRYKMSVDASTTWATVDRQVYTVGYPGKPINGLYEPTLLETLFETLFGYKRLAPGLTLASQRSNVAWTVAHDATTLAGNSGSAVVELSQPRKLVGVHYGGTKVTPAENWGHLLGLALPAEGEAREKLLTVLERSGVAVV